MKLHVLYGVWQVDYRVPCLGEVGQAELGLGSRK